MTIQLTTLSRREPFDCPGCRQPTRETYGGRCASCLHRTLVDEVRVGNVLREHLQTSVHLGTRYLPADLMLALTSVSRVLTYGRIKHESLPWRQVDAAVHERKAEGHRRRHGTCLETGQPHRAHAICRELFLLQLELEREGRS